MFLCILLSYPGQSLSLDHVNSGYIRDVMFRVIYKLKQARLQATLSSHRRVQRFCHRSPVSLEDRPQYYANRPQRDGRSSQEWSLYRYTSKVC